MKPIWLDYEKFSDIGDEKVGYWALVFRSPAVLRVQDSKESVKLSSLKRLKQIVSQSLEEIDLMIEGSI